MNQTRCVSHKTIENMESGGAPQAHIDYARQTQNSMDPRDVVFHRKYIKDYNPQDPWREPNNFVLHPLDYKFGKGNSSPEYIGGMLGTLPDPVHMSCPETELHPAIQPYVVFDQHTQIGPVTRLGQERAPISGNYSQTKYHTPTKSEPWTQIGPVFRR